MGRLTPDQPTDVAATTCEYCKRSQPFGTGACVGCGGPLPPPPVETRVVHRRLDVSSQMLDITSFNDLSQQFVAGPRSAILSETVETRGGRIVVPEFDTVKR